MKEKLKNILSKKIFYVTLSLLIIVIVEIVYASNLINSKNVLYSNSSSKLSSTNVQGAIDELYNSCKDVKNECPENKECFNFSAKTTIIKLNADIVTSGDGLYKDKIESNKYFYRGKNVNNYIIFNNELWRTLNINSDGTIKIVKDGYYSTSKSFDTSGGEYGSNNWARPADLNAELNNAFYNSLSKSSQNMIKTSTWDIGNVSWTSNQSIGTEISQEKATTWTGKVALFTVSEYIRTNSNVTCHTGPVDYHDGTNGNPGYSICNKTTWLYDPNNIIWSLSPNSGYSYHVWIVSAVGGINTNYAFNPLAVMPALNLKATVQITGGDGSSSNPFTLTNS